MPDNHILPIDITSGIFRYTRDTWMEAGVDDFTSAPSQNPDMMEALTNILPPMTNSLVRRFGYATFAPSLDQGIGINGDMTNSALLFGTGFDGASGYVYTANAFTFSKLAPLYSIEFWFQTFTAAGGYLVTAVNDQTITSGEQAYFGVAMNTSGQLVATFYNGGTAYSATSSGSYNDGLPHMVDVTLSATSLILYVDSVSVATATPTAGSGTVSLYWRMMGTIGDGTYFSNSYSYMQGFISHVSIADAILTPTQITNDYNALINTGQSGYETQVASNGPVYFWYLNETPSAMPPIPTPTVQTAQANILTNTGGTVSFGGNITTGNTILVSLGHVSSGVPTISDSLSNTYTLVQDIQNDGGYGMYVWIAPVTNGGACTITITTDHNAQILIVAQELGGLIASPLDNSNISESNNQVSFTGPSITTASANDRVYSLVFAQQAAAISSTSGYGVTQTFAAADPEHGFTSFLGVAYASAAEAGSYAAPTWSVTGTKPTVWIGITLGLTVKTIAASGVIAFDHADSNNGTYNTSIPAPKAVTLLGSTESTAQVVALTVSPSAGSPISVGDTGILLFMTDPTPDNLPITGVTDSKGNSWVQIYTLSVKDQSGSPTYGLEAWFGGMATAVTYPSSMTVNVTFTGSGSQESTLLFTQFQDFDGLGAIGNTVQLSHNGSGETWSSGGITTSTTSAIIATTGASGNDISAPTIAAPFQNAQIQTSGTGLMAMASCVDSGLVVDTWSSNISGILNFGAAVTAFAIANGYFLGESVVVS